MSLKAGKWESKGHSTREKDSIYLLTQGVVGEPNTYVGKFQKKKSVLKKRKRGLTIYLLKP